MLRYVSSRNSKRLTGALALVISGALALSGCGDQTTTTAGLQVTSLSSSPSTMTSGATSVVQATVVENSSPVADRVVTFSVTPASAGFFTPSVDTSDANGMVATVFTSSTTGSASISAAVSGGTGASTPITINSTQQSGSGNISINISSSLLLADGASTATVTVTVLDASNNVAPNGTVVRLTSGEKFVDVDGNGYWSAGVDSLVFDANANQQWDAYGTIPANAVVAGGAGQVVVTFIAGTIASTAYIYASVNDGAFTGGIEASIQLTPNAVVNSIELDVDDTHLAVKQTGGLETSTIRAWCYDENGNAIPEGVTVVFVITDGPGGGEYIIPSVGYGPYNAVTNAQGMAIAPISSDTVSGTIKIRATVGTILSNTTEILVHAGPAVEIAVGVDTCNARMWRLVDGRVGVTAVVSDFYHNPVRDSIVVWFTTDEGQIIAHQESTFDENGVVTSGWISGYDVTGHDGGIWIFAETSGGTVRDSVFFFNSDVVRFITLSGFPASLDVDGEDNDYFRVLLSDLNNNPVINGLIVDHREKFVTIGTDLSEGQCAGSFVEATITRAGPLTRDYSVPIGVDDGIGAVDNVTFTLEDGSITVAINLLTGTSYSKNSAIDELEGSMGEGQAAPFNATIMDRFGNPLGGHTLTASASAGTITNGTLRTNEHGEVYGFVFTAPVDPAIDKVTISVVDTDPRGGGMILTESVTIIH